MNASIVMKRNNIHDTSCGEQQCAAFLEYVFIECNLFPGSEMNVNYNIVKKNM